MRASCPLALSLFGGDVGFQQEGGQWLRATKPPCHDMIQAPAARFPAAALGLPSLFQPSTALQMETQLGEFVSLVFCTNIYTFPSRSFNLRKGATDFKRCWHLSILLHRPIQHKLPIPLHFLPKECLVSKKKGKLKRWDSSLNSQWIFVSSGWLFPYILTNSLRHPPPRHLGSTLSTLEVFILCRLNSICWMLITESCKNRWTIICPDFQSSPWEGYLHKNILLKDQRIFFPPLYTQLHEVCYINMGTQNNSDSWN